MNRFNSRSIAAVVGSLSLLAGGVFAGWWLIAGGTIIVSNMSQSSHAEELATAQTSKDLETATLGGGCFWCTEAVFQELKGVKSVASGYSGGSKANPTYEEVCGGLTGHAEVIQVTYDPAEVTFAELLEVFWKTHDPTTLNRQGADVGTQYRSVVFYHNEQQKAEAEKYKQKLDEAGAFSDPIVTEISPFEKFYEAEKYHQDYYSLNPQQGYCRAVITPKLAKFREVFPSKLKGAEDSVKDPEASSQLEDGVDWSKVDWKAKLTPEQYRVTCQEGTERPFENEYWDNKKQGVYKCVRCGLPLFDSEAKYKSGTGWPSFYQPVDGSHISEHVDRRLFSVRTETRCARCDSHLGHVFGDGPEPTGLRYCMNSAALSFEEAKDSKDVEASAEHKE